MKTPKLIVVIALGAVALFAAPAAAQDGPDLMVDPPRIDEAGEITFTVTGDGWTQEALLVLPCPVPASGNLADLTSDLCDVSDLTPVTPEDGGFETEVTYTVPEEGLVILAGDPAQNESAAAVIMVGPEELDDEPAEEIVEEEAPVDDDAATEDEPAEEPEETETAEAEADAELAQTGSETGLIAIVGLSLALFGAMLVSTSRRVQARS